MRLTLALSSFLLALTCALTAEIPGERSAPLAQKPADPAKGLGGTGPLTKEERARLLELFGEISSNDFDVREKARARLLAGGPRALAVAREMEESDDLDTRDFARSFSRELLLRYRGYLPTTQELKEVLDEPCRLFIGQQEPFAEAFRRFTRGAGLRVIFENNQTPDPQIANEKTVEMKPTVGEGLRYLLMNTGLEPVPRGNALLITTAERAKTLRIQEHSFDLAPLSLDYATAKWLAETFEGWLPEGSEVSAAESKLRVRASEETLRLAARALYLLQPNAPAANFPSIEASEVKRLFAGLARPVPAFVLRGESPATAVKRLAEAGYPVKVTPHDRNNLYHDPSLAMKVALTLDLRDVPAGLCLSWMIKRGNTVVADAPPRLIFAYEAEPPSLVFNLSSLDVPCSENAGGADVSFLFQKQNQFPREECERVREQLLRALSDEWALYPCPDADHALTLFQNRMLVRGPAALVGRTLLLVEAWRADGKPPVAAWRKEIERRLNTEVEWSGEATVPTLLEQLRDATSLNILLERNASRPLALEMSAADAQLLPRGHRTPKALLDQLAAAIQARWTIAAGVILLTNGK